MEIKCIHQLFRSKTKLPYYLRPQGCGDCTICMPSEDNKNCKCYAPVKLAIFYIKEEKK